MILDVDDVVGAAEIARMLGGISRQRVQQIVSRTDFPKPFKELAMGKIWRSEDVRTWAEENGRTVVDDDE